MKNDNKKSALGIVLAVIITAVVAVTATYLITTKFASDNNSDEKLEEKDSGVEKDKSTESVNDESDVKTSKEDVTKKENKIFNDGDYGVEYIANFEGINKEFAAKVKEKVDNRTISSGLKYVAEFNYEKNSNIESSYYKLNDSVISSDSIDGPYYESHDSISMNVDTKTGKEMTNEEVIKLYNSTNVEVAKAILNDVVSHISRETLFKSTNGDITAPVENVSNVNKENSEYIENLSKNLNGNVVVYIKNGNLCIDYHDSKVLELVGLSSHMNVGLKTVTQTVTM